MKFSTELYGLFLVSGLLAFIVPLLREGLRAQFRFTLDKAATLHSLLILLAGLAFLALVGEPMLTPVYAGAFLLYWLIRRFHFNPTSRGALLLLASVAILPLVPLSEENPLTWVAAIFGLLGGRLTEQGESDTSENGWEDFLLPAAWLVGTGWIELSQPESSWAVQHGLLTITLSVTLLLRTLQGLRLFPDDKPAAQIAQNIFLIITGTLGVWLCIQTFLLQPALLRWAWLFSGSLLLGALLSASEKLPGDRVTRQLIVIVLIGLAALVASRLYFTLGWLIVAVALLAYRKMTLPLMLAALFFVGRTFLQYFITAYNPNVTGINITHPYADAALYGGITLMLLAPAALKSWAKNPKGRLWLAVACIPAGAFANYFLHAEAASSLLVALTVGAFGVSLLSKWEADSQSVQPLLLSMFITTGAILSHPLIATGNSSDKTQKMIMLTAGLVIYTVLLWLIQRNAADSGSSEAQPVEVA